jgi:hypothetical protein
VGVDLMPLGNDRFVGLVLNGAVEFDDTYSFKGGNVFEAAATALGSLPTRLAAHTP